MSKYIIRAATLQSIASAIRTKTGKTDKIPVESFAKEIEEISGGGGGIIEVDALPTENIDETALYKSGDSYYKYSLLFKDILIYVLEYDVKMWFGTDAEYYTLSELPDEADYETVFKVSGDILYAYFIEKENDIYVYGDPENTGTNTLLTLEDVFGIPFKGFIPDPETEVTEEGYYALGGNSWKEYLAPEGSVTIVANGTFDVKEKSEVVVNVETLLQEKTVTENGVVTADEGYDGLSKVTVSVPQPSGELEITENGTYDVTDKASVIVDVESESTGGATVNASLTHTAGKPMVILSAIINSGTPTASVTREE